MLWVWGREDNRGSGVALAMRHRLQWFIHLRAHGHREGDEHPTYAPNWSMVHFFILLMYTYTSTAMIARRALVNSMTYNGMNELRYSR